MQLSIKPKQAARITLQSSIALSNKLPGSYNDGANRDSREEFRRQGQIFARNQIKTR